MTDTLRFEAQPDWEQLPGGYTHRDVCGVAVDSHDRVFILARGDARVIVYERDGTFAASWGEDVFTERTHGITIGPDDSVYTTDDGDHTVRKFTPEGRQLMILGTPNEPSDTGYHGKGGLDSISHGGPPFNRPTGVAVAADGEIYVCDGYGNARVHRFTAEGELIQSWGEPGCGPGEFYLPHGICVTRDDRVMVADRENDRVQIFSREGKFVDQWPHVQRPTDVCEGRDGDIYVANLWWRVGQSSYVNGPTRFDLPGHVSVLDSGGNLLLSWVSADRCAPGNFVAPHALSVDSEGDLYVGEVTFTFGVARGDIAPGCHMFQKLVRRAARR